MSTLERKPETDDRASWHNEQTCKGLKTFKAENRPVSHKPARNHWPRYEAKNQFPEMNATVKTTRNVAATASSVTSLKLLPVSLFQKSDYRPPQKNDLPRSKKHFPILFTSLSVGVNPSQKQKNEKKQKNRTKD